MCCGVGGDRATYIGDCVGLMINNIKNILPACVLINNPKFGDLALYVACIIGQSIIPFIFALAVAVFVWAVIYLYRHGHEKTDWRLFVVTALVVLGLIVWSMAISWVQPTTHASWYGRALAYGVANIVIAIVGCFVGGLTSCGRGDVESCNE